MKSMSKINLWQIMAHCAEELIMLMKTSSNQPCGRIIGHNSGAFLKCFSVGYWELGGMVVETRRCLNVL